MHASSPRPLLLSRGWIAEAAKSMHAVGLVAKERVDSLWPASAAAADSRAAAENEIWNLGSQIPSGGRRATRVDVPAARGVLPSPSTLCALSAQAFQAAPGQPGRERGWYQGLWVNVNTVSTHLVFTAPRRC